MASERMSLEGEVVKILFQNEENGYTVCILEDALGVEYTLTGTMPALRAGEHLKARVIAGTHPVHGRQWRVTEFEKQMPTDTEAIRRYLSSRAIRGIGPKLAERIVARFGEDTLDILENSPEMLSAVPGVSPKVAHRAGEEFRAQFGLRRILLFFGETFGMKTALSIYRALGSSAVDLVQNNPYLLCERVRGIGFVRSDELAAKIGISASAPARVRAGLVYVLKQAWQKDGHVFLPRAMLLEHSCRLLELSEEVLAEGLEALLRDGILVATRGGAHVYLQKAYHLEREAARRLFTLSSIRLFQRIPGVSDAIAKVEEAEGIRYEEHQRQAILTAAQSPFSIITGGPGTGKTTVTRALYRLFDSLGMSVCLAAPTGRAARRLSERSGQDAATLHRVLEMAHLPEEDAPRFGRGEDKPLDESVFLIDEVSMVDLELFVAFLRAVKPGSRVVFLGDADQLPSVGAGCVLSDLICSGAIPTTYLEVVHRQAKESRILSFAHEVRRGVGEKLRANEGDLFFLEREGAESAAATVCELLSTRLPATYGEEVLSDLQVLCPSRKGAVGTVQLNVSLQAALNPPRAGIPEVPHGERVFRVGDRVMQTKNNYELEGRCTLPDGESVRVCGVFNGDVGVVEDVDFSAQSLSIRFDSTTLVDYPFSLLEELEHAFAVTVHKSQGSEYKTAILVAAATPPMLRRRCLLYTAVTRAKERLILVGERRMIQEMIRDDRREERYSALADCIREAL